MIRHNARFFGKLYDVVGTSLITISIALTRIVGLMILYDFLALIVTLLMVSLVI